MSIRHTLSLFILLTLVASTDASVSYTDLLQIEKEMPESWEIAMTKLENFPVSSLKNRSEKALFSLLQSLSIDESGAMLSSDSLIAPALNYYSRHGSATHRMKTFYCRGRVDENRFDLNSAMEWYKKAEGFLERTQDFRTGGKIYQHKAELYKAMYDFRDAIYNCQSASECFLKAGDTISYFHNLLNLTELYILMDDDTSASRTIEVLPSCWKELDGLSKAKYYCATIRLAIRQDDSSALEKAEEMCTAEFISTNGYKDLALALAESSLQLGYPDDALRHLEDCPESSEGSESDSKYLELLSRILEEKGDYEGAYKACLESNRNSGKNTLGILNSDAKFIEERYEETIRELKTSKKTKTILSTSLIVLATLILLIHYMLEAAKTVRQELNVSEIKIKELTNERDALRNVLDKSRFIDEKSREMINKRFELLDKVLVSRLTGNKDKDSGIRADLDKLTGNKNEFITSLAEAMAMSHPSFHNYLTNSSLNGFEIGFCYLYIMGMQKKDVENFLSKRCIDTVTKDIRDKLDLEKDDVKLKTIIAKKFNELEGSRN